MCSVLSTMRKKFNVTGHSVMVWGLLEVPSENECPEILWMCVGTITVNHQETMQNIPVLFW